MIIEVGKTYVNRVGQKVKVVYRSPLDTDEHPFLCVYERNQAEFSHWCRQGGARSTHSLDDYDLMHEYKEPQYYYTAWRDTWDNQGVTALTYESEESARQRGTNMRAIARINLETFQVEQLPL